MIQTYFLTRGYYNFQLGMGLFLLLLGYAGRRLQVQGKSTLVTLGLGFVVLYFTHILPLAIAVFALVTVAGWVHLAVPVVTRHERSNTVWKPGVKNMARLLAVLSPAILLGLMYAVLSMRDTHHSMFGFDWRRFPSYLFRMSSGAGAPDGYLFGALALAFVAVLWSMKTLEWRGPTGGLAVATVTVAPFAVFGPDAGFGGIEVKVRLAWAAILMGGVLSVSVTTPRILSATLTLSAAALAVLGLVRIAQVNARLSVLADTYISVLQSIPPRSTVLRLSYAMPASLQKAGVPADLLFAPLLHTDSCVAALTRSTLLTDYEAATRTFPIAFQPVFSSTQQRLLERLEAAGIGPTLGSPPTASGPACPCGLLRRFGGPSGRSCDVNHPSVWQEAGEQRRESRFCADFSLMRDSLQGRHLPRTTAFEHNRCV